MEQERSQSEEQAERIARALSVIGKFSSGAGHNFATEHDEELADITFEHVRGK